METFVNVGGWRSAALLLNLTTFFFAFSAFSVGLLIAARVRRLLGSELLQGVVVSFLIASGALSVRCLAITMFHLGWLNRIVAIVVSDSMLLFLGGGLFYAYLVFERYLKTKEAA